MKDPFILSFACLIVGVIIGELAMAYGGCQ